MVTNSTPFSRKIFSKVLVWRALQGAAVAIILLFILVLLVSQGQLESWVLAPLATVMIGGALAGAVFHLIDPLHYEGSKRFAAITFCIIFFLAATYFSLIPGLAMVGLWD